MERPTRLASVGLFSAEAVATFKRGWSLNDPLIPDCEICKGAKSDAFYVCRNPIFVLCRFLTLFVSARPNF